jgi:N-acetylglucosaminyldiphosphoundecaprenol N-acetyl-beta-D-mannosaminyltransferase
MIYPSVPVMGYKVYSSNLENVQVGEDMVVINTLNAYSYVRAEEDPVFKEALLSSDILVADGFPIVLAARLIGGYKIKKIAGADIFFYMLHYLNDIAGSCFFLGAGIETLERIKSRISLEYPRITVSCYSPPFKDNYSAEETNEMIKAVNQSDSFVVFIGMTAPKQEKWVFENKKNLQAKVVCSIGAVFDFYAETVKRPSKFWVKLNLEWFIRFLKEPKRLGKRYFIYSPKFFKYLLCSLVKPNKHSR